MSDTAVSAARSRHPRRIDLGGGSWIDVFDTIPPGCRLSPTAFRALWAKAPTERNNIRMYGKVLKEARATQSFIRGYRYANVDHPAASDTVPEELAPLSAWVQRNLAPDTVAFNQVLVNWYDPARGDYIGPHSDNTDGMTPGAPIVSVSYGGTRRFRVSPKVAGPNFEPLGTRHDLIRDTI